MKTMDDKKGYATYILHLENTNRDILETNEKLLRDVKMFERALTLGLNYINSGNSIEKGSFIYERMRDVMFRSGRSFNLDKDKR